MAPTTTSAFATSTPTCINVAPGKNGYLPPESCDVILYYVPSFAAAILFCVLFGLTTAIHTFQAFQYKKRYTWTIIMGALWELLAFIFRALGTRQQNKDEWSQLYTIFFLLAPIWINAFIYMTLGRMVHFFIPDRRLWHISAHHFGTIFVCLDIFAFLVQAAGAGMSGMDDQSKVMLGLHIYMGGIGLQEAFIICFLGLTIHLHRKMIEMENAGQRLEKLSQCAFPWRWLFYSIYLALGLITVRIIFRLAQYAQGTSATNPILTHEWFEYVLDAAPMFLALAAFNFTHPGRILQGADSEFPRVTRAEKKQQKMLKKMAKEQGKKDLSRDSSDDTDEHIPLNSPVAPEQAEYRDRYYGA